MSLEPMIAAAAGWLLTVALHGAMFLSAAWLIDRAWRAPPNAWRELMWRVALFGGVVTASLQPLAGTSPIAARWQLAGAAASNAIAPATAAARAADTQSVSVGPPIAARYAGAATTPASAAVTTTASPATALPIAPARAPNWPAWIVAVWLLGASFALTRVVRSLRELRRALRDAAPTTAEPAADELAELVERAAVRAPRLLSLAGIASPMATTGARIVAPAWALESMDRRQLRAMLAHELAHIVRHDPQWKVLSALWRALFWFLPLTGLAQRRLDDLAELACDAYAVQHTGNARGVAECLAACAEHHLGGSAYALAAAMAVHESSFRHRIECLLEGVSMQPIVSGVRSRALALVVLAAAGLCLPTISLLGPQVAQAAPAPPAPPVAPAPPEPPAAPKAEASGHSSISIHSDDDGNDRMTISLSDDGHKLRANVDGKIAFSDDERDVASLSAGGTASFEETRAGVTHRIEFAERNGKLERRYFVDRREQPLDAAGNAWLAELLPSLIRESGIGAEARVQRLYTAGGAARVLDEIERIHSDYVRGIYLGLLLDRGTLTPAQLDQALKIAGSAQSDYQRRQMLDKLFAKQSLSAAQQVTFLQQALRFNSDYELAELLIAVVPKLADSPEVRQAWLTAGLRVSSDYERRRTLEAMLTRDNFDDSQLGSVLEASAKMGSDYEHRELLVAVARRAHDVDALAPAYAQSTQSLGSDYERREALVALIRAGKLGPRGTKAVLDSAAHIGSDYECREVLVALARVMPDDAASVQHYREVAGRLSEYERGEAEHALRR